MSTRPLLIRDRNPNNIPTFVEKLEVVDCSSIKACDEPDIAYKRFHEMYTKIYNYCFPLKKATRKKWRFKKPWLTKALLKSIKTKNKLYKNTFNFQQSTILVYKRYKNKLNHTLRLAKRRYYKKKLEDANTHAPWKILNEVLNTKQPRPQLNTIFKSDGRGDL